MLDRILSPSNTPLPWLTPLHIFVGAAALSVILVIVGTCSLYSISGPLPPPRQPPPLPETATITSYRFKTGFYEALLDEQTKKLGLKRDAAAAISHPNPYFTEFSGYQRLKVGGTLETNHLRLSAAAQKIWVGEEGQRFRSDHLLLQIANKSSRPVAYRVTTEATGRCAGKGILPQNALALKPGEEVTRTECTLHGSALAVKQVEVLEISLLGYYWVSQLDPQRLIADGRTTEGHQIPTLLGPCRLLPWRAIQASAARGDTRWYDVIDFYSRHGCNDYTFFVGYRWSAKGPGKLPVKSPGAE